MTSLHHFFHPKVVAVVGASRNKDRLGHVLFRHILNSDFRGTVYPVNPSAQSVAAVRAYPSLRDVPEPVDLAVLVVPASQVLSVIDDVIAAGIKHVMILSSGFSDMDKPGEELEREISEKLRAAGCRLIGPNSLGLIQMDSETRLNASFAPKVPEYGHVAIASHSGALGITILDYAAYIGLGVASFVSLGNRADVSGNDLLQYWGDDPAIEMILLYLESFGNPRNFSRLARRITRQKPILAVKSARTPVGHDVANARTVSVAAEDATVEAMFLQAGVIRVDTLQELFDVAVLLKAGPTRGGRRVAVVTNTAGGAVMTVDRIVREGLDFVGPVINVGFETLAESYREVLPQVLRDPSVDSVIVLFTPVGPSNEEAVRVAISTALCEVANDPPAPGVRHPYEKPVVANFLTTGDYRVRMLEVDSERQIPIYPFPEQAVRALAKVVAYHEYREKDPGVIPFVDGIDTDLARARMFQEISAKSYRGEEDVQGLVMLDWPAVREVLAAIGLDAADAPNAQAEEQASFNIVVETDPLFGPLLRLYLSSEERGAAALRRSAKTLPTVRLLPLTDADARELWSDALLNSASSRMKPHEDVVIDAMIRMSQWVEDVPEIVEADLYFVIEGDRAVCVAGRVEVARRNG
ncbi:acetate--CoA ligase family protein [Alicyclobacillus mali (ex Roth et al. 2021)]|uniref:acetate--CoA ligase family protein n=1 Tax=Alicyclobacillus mali (ex Roth et al. 2021) TaxID=1123961 RepID=UPI001A8DB467|nr:CoA-binding protein [Alicyclobacillus mali (ex Roth et al. 2021)]